MTRKKVKNMDKSEQEESWFVGFCWGMLIGSIGMGILVKLLEVQG